MAERAADGKEVAGRLAERAAGSASDTADGRDSDTADGRESNRMGRERWDGVTADGA